MESIYKWIRKLLKNKRKTITHEEMIYRIKSTLQTEKSAIHSILPEQFRKQFHEYAFISGGCIYSLYNDETPKDYDFFFTSQELTDELREYFMDQCGYHGSGMSGGTFKNYPLLVTDNAISIGKYQLITRWVGEPESVVEEFDFCHNMFYYYKDEIQSLCDFEVLSSKELKYNDKRARDIVGTIIRVPKFIKRGMNIKQKEMAKMLLKLHEVGFNERELEILQSANSDKSFGS